MRLAIMWTPCTSMGFGSACPTAEIRMTMRWPRASEDLKNEEVYLWEYETLADVEKRIPFFSEEVYNRKRLHSSLRYQSPEEFERMILKNNQTNPCLSSLS